MPSRFVFPLVHLPLFLFANLAWLVAVTGTAMMAALLVSGRGLDLFLDADALVEWLGAGGVGGLTAIQIIGFAAIAAVLSLLLPAPTEPRLAWLPGNIAAGWERVRAGLALSRSRLIWLATAGIGATTVWMFPTWLAERLLELLPDYPSGLEVIAELLQGSEGLARWVMIGAIVVTAPLFEELVFRGYLWRVVEIAAPPSVAAIVTTLLFAAYHVDPVHIVALLPTAAFLGWLRYASRSVFPCIVAHLTNNAIATGLAFGQAADSTDTMPLGLALTGFAFTLTAAFVGARFARWSASSV